MNEYKMIINYKGDKKVKLDASGALNDLSELLLEDVDKNKYSRRRTLKSIGQVKESLEELLKVYMISGREVTNSEYMIRNRIIKQIRKDQKQAVEVKETEAAK